VSKSHRHSLFYSTRKPYYYADVRHVWYGHDEFSWISAGCHQKKPRGW